MARTRRSSSPEILIARLEQKHAKLKKRVTELSGRTYLTPDEQLEHAKLKKEKLVMKDELMKMKLS